MAEKNNSNLGAADGGKLIIREGGDVIIAANRMPSEDKHTAAGKRLPMSGFTKVNVARGLLATTVAFFGLVHYGDPEKQKVKEISPAGMTNADKAVAERDYKNSTLTTADKVAKLRALQDSKPGEQGFKPGKETAAQQRTRGVAEAMAGAAAPPTMEELTRTAPDVGALGKTGVYASAIAVKATHNSSFMGTAAALGFLGLATTAMRLLTSIPLRFRRQFQNPGLRDGVGVTSLLYGYDTKEQNYMKGLREGQLLDTAKNTGVAANKRSGAQSSPTETFEDIQKKYRQHEIPPRLFPLFRKSQVEPAILGGNIPVYTPKEGTTIDERMKIAAAEEAHVKAAAAQPKKPGTKPSGP